MVVETHELIISVVSDYLLLDTMSNFFIGIFFIGMNFFIEMKSLFRSNENYYY